MPSDLHQVNFVTLGGALAPFNPSLTHDLRAQGIICKNYYFSRPDYFSYCELYHCLEQNISVKDIWTQCEAWRLVNSPSSDPETLYQLFAPSLAENIGLSDLISRQKPGNQTIIFVKNNFPTSIRSLLTNFFNGHHHHELYFLDKLLWRLEIINPAATVVVIKLPLYQHLLQRLFNPLINNLNHRIATFATRYHNLRVSPDML